jgi:large subunit ribosomal protein L40e
MQYDQIMNITQPSLNEFFRPKHQPLPQQACRVRHLCQTAMASAALPVSIGALLVDDKAALANYKVPTQSAQRMHGGMHSRPQSEPPTGKTSTLDVEALALTDTLKAKVQTKCGVPLDQQRRVFGGRQLEDGRALAEDNIQNGSVIDLALRLRGGALGDDRNVKQTLTSGASGDGNGGNAGNGIGGTSGAAAAAPSGGAIGSPGSNRDGQMIAVAPAMVGVVQPPSETYARSEQAVLLMRAYSRGNPSWTCPNCTAMWCCFPVVDYLVQEVAVHSGGQFQIRFVDAQCLRCTVQWRRV